MTGESASERKERHLSICVDPVLHRVETRAGGSGWERLSFAHRALPELSLAAIDSGSGFLGYRLRLPLLASCMTGGSAGGGRVNQVLAAAANEARIAFGLGSFRVLLRDSSWLADFQLRRLLPDVPLLANIGAVSLREHGHAAVLDIARRLEADALVVHLNPAQELFQEGGDRDFVGLRDALSGLFEASPLPVIVKETGFGIGPAEARALLAAGASQIDLAGAGGTNWIAVEAERLDPGPLRDAAADFQEWGYPTALLLAAIAGGGTEPARLIASGGIRSGLDLAKALALGAGLVGTALPLLRAVESGGRDGALAFIERLAFGLRSVMLLTGSASIEALRRGILIADSSFHADVRSLASADTAAFL
ncbi:MAG: type 2 isopentenyl-diphosphate Delta-isomerase [Spirochaetota bacterium]